MSDEALCTPAWLLLGTTDSVAGVLELADDHLAFTILDGRVFDVALNEVRSVKFPWRLFGRIARIMIGEEVYRVSFIRPKNAGLVPDCLIAHVNGATFGPSVLRTAGRNVLDIGTGCRAGKAWKTLLLARIGI